MDENSSARFYARASINCQETNHVRLRSGMRPPLLGGDMKFLSDFLAVDIGLKKEMSLTASNHLEMTPAREP